MKLFRLLTVAALLASAGSFAGNWFLYQQYQAESTAGGELESRLVQLEEQNQSLRGQASQTEGLEQELMRLRDQVKGYVSQRDNLKKELDGTLSEAARLKKRIQTLESEKQSLQDRANEVQVTESAVAREAAKIAGLPPATSLNGSTVPAVPASASLPASKPSKESLKEPVREPVKQQPAKETAKTSSTPAPAPRVEEKPEKSGPFAPLPATSEAVVDQRPLQILSVNRQFKFVVINGGIRGKIKIGDTLRVEQNGKLIGRIQVEKLYENFSACNIVEEIPPAEIREGDLVRLA